MATERPSKNEDEPPVRTYAIIAGGLVLAAMLYGVIAGRQVQRTTDASPGSHPTAVVTSSAAP